MTIRPAFLTILFLLCVALCACSGVPKVATPDGSQRIPINTQSAIADFQNQLATQDSGDEAALRLQIDAMKREIADLKQMLAMQTKSKHAPGRQATTAREGPMKAAALRLKPKRHHSPVIKVPALVIASNRSTL
jgi:hypothetical protein